MSTLPLTMISNSHLAVGFHKPDGEFTNDDDMSKYMHEQEQPVLLLQPDTQLPPDVDDECSEEVNCTLNWRGKQPRKSAAYSKVEQNRTPAEEELPWQKFLKSAASKSKNVVFKKPAFFLHDKKGPSLAEIFRRELVDDDGLFSSGSDDTVDCEGETSGTKCVGTKRTAKGSATADEVAEMHTDLRKKPWNTAVTVQAETESASSFSAMSPKSPSADGSLLCFGSNAERGSGLTAPLESAASAVVDGTCTTNSISFPLNAKVDICSTSSYPITSALYTSEASLNGFSLKPLGGKPTAQSTVTHKGCCAVDSSSRFCKAPESCQKLYGRDAGSEIRDGLSNIPDILESEYRREPICTSGAAPYAARDEQAVVSFCSAMSRQNSCYSQFSTSKMQEQYNTAYKSCDDSSVSMNRFQASREKPNVAEPRDWSGAMQNKGNSAVGGQESISYLQQQDTPTLRHKISSTEQRSTAQSAIRKCINEQPTELDLPTPQGIFRMWPDAVRSNKDCAALSTQQRLPADGFVTNHSKTPVKQTNEALGGTNYGSSKMSVCASSSTIYPVSTPAHLQCNATHMQESSSEAFGASSLLCNDKDKAGDLALAADSTSTFLDDDAFFWFGFDSCFDEKPENSSNAAAAQNLQPDEKRYADTAYSQRAVGSRDEPFVFAQTSFGDPKGEWPSCDSHLRSGDPKYANNHKASCFQSQTYKQIQFLDDCKTNEVFGLSQEEVQDFMDLQL